MLHIRVSWRNEKVIVTIGHQMSVNYQLFFDIASTIVVFGNNFINIPFVLQKEHLPYT